MKEGDFFEKEFCVNEKFLDTFIYLSKDKNPIHTNNEFANRYGFKKKNVHGNIQNVFLSYFVGEMLPVKNIVIISQKISFLKPLYQNEKFRLFSEIKNITQSVSVVEFKFKFINSEDEIISNGELIIKVLQ